MNSVKDFGWNRLRHGGLLLDTPRFSQVAETQSPYSGKGEMTQMGLFD